MDTFCDKKRNCVKNESLLELELKRTLWGHLVIEANQSWSVILGRDHILDFLEEDPWTNDKNNKYFDEEFITACVLQLPKHWSKLLAERSSMIMKKLLGESCKTHAKRAEISG